MYQSTTFRLSSLNCGQPQSGCSTLGGKAPPCSVSVKGEELVLFIDLEVEPFSIRWLGMGGEAAKCGVPNPLISRSSKWTS